MYYTKLNPTTKKAQAFIASYNNSNDYSVNHVYGTCSTAKTRAESMLLRKMIENNGNGYKVLSFNTFNFSAGWLCALGLVIETACNTFLIPYDVTTGEVLD